MRSLLRASKKAKPASSQAHMVVGLRNPGADYEGTRHNAGYEVVARIAVRHDTRFSRAPSRVRCEVAQVGVGDSRVLYVVPSTFMNDSGSAVRAAAGYYGIDLSRVLVVHDDIDLAFGRLRLQVNGGSGGHNGSDPWRRPWARRISVVSSSGLAARPARSTPPTSCSAPSARPNASKWMWSSKRPPTWSSNGRPTLHGPRRWPPCAVETGLPNDQPENVSFGARYVPLCVAMSMDVTES